MTTKEKEGSDGKDALVPEKVDALYGTPTARETPLPLLLLKIRRMREKS